MNNLIYKSFFTTILISLFQSAQAQVPTAQDCLGAIPICSDTISVPTPYPYSGNGNYLNEINALLGCYTPESNGVWYTFTVQTSGLLRFTLSPDDPNDDYDWIMYDMTNSNCNVLSTFASSAIMESSNTWGAFGFNGDIGISTPNGGIGNCNGPGTTNGPKWNADLPVTAGNTYVLYISNWSGSTFGFSLDFSASTAQIFDNVPPSFDTITSAVTCDPFDSLVIELSENVLCSSIQSGDFALNGPGGPYTITGFNSSVCNAGGDYTDEITVYFSPAVSTPGNYSFEIQSGAGYIEDLCGNLDTLDSLTFIYGEVDVTSTFTEPLCNGSSTGTISSNSVGGTAPFTFAWSGGLPNDSNQTGLSAGIYTVTVTDDQGCEGFDTITLTQPAPFNFTINDVSNISCPGVSNCNGGADISVNGSTPPYSYLWDNGNQTPTPTNLCAGGNWMVVTDDNGCQDSILINIQIPDSIQTLAGGDTLICISNQTPINAASIGGTPPYQYVWYRDSAGGPTEGTGASIQVSPNRTRTYVVVSTDDNGCLGDTAEVEVRVRPKLNLIVPEIDTICPDDTIDITIEGVGGDSNYTYVWETLGFGPTQTVSPDQSEWYYFTVTDVCGTPAYADSAFVQVGGYHDIRAEIRGDKDSICIGEEVTLIADGDGGHNGPEEYTFKWNSTASGYPVQFVKPQKTNTYKITITDECLSERGIDTFTIYVGEPELPEISIDPAQACKEANVSISIPEAKKGYDYDWNLGDGSIELNFKENEIIHSYSSIGCYDISLNTITNFGCESKQKIDCGVEIFLKPKASFTTQPDQPSNVDPIVYFSNESTGHNDFYWSIVGDTLWNIEGLNQYFEDRSTPYRVSLIAFSAEGCSDTVSRQLLFDREVVLYYPTSFTPDGDGLNDVFIIEGEEINPEGYDLIIYDRWGNQIFRSKNPFYGWNGMINEKNAPLGTYPFTLKYIDEEGEIQLVRDNVHIIKTQDRSGDAR